MTGMTGTTLTLGVISGWVVALAVLFIVVSLFMMLVILIQKPKGGGLGGAFGGGAGSGTQQAVFGAKAGDALTWFTIVSFVLFLLIAMGLTWAINPEVQQPQAAGAGAGTPASTAGAGAGAGGTAGASGAGSGTTAATPNPAAVPAPPQTQPAGTGDDGPSGMDILTQPLLPGIDAEPDSDSEAEPESEPAFGLPLGE
ncbi:MAG: preprotein translocase subunit SecG [Planctomycetota bacterium]